MTAPRPASKSSITIRDGVGLINFERVTEDVDCEDLGGPGRDYDFHTRRMRIDCRNGYTLSVVFDTGTYSSNRDLLGDTPFREEVETAEIALLGPGGLSTAFSDEWGDEVKGHCDAEEIMKWLFLARQLDEVHPPTEAPSKFHREPST